MQMLDGDQQGLDAEQVRHASPGAFLARQRSRAEFEHLGAAQAVRVAREAFPSLVEKRDGGVPELPGGERIRRFSTPDVAQVSLPHHARAIIEATAPMAMRTSSGALGAIDLALESSGSAFVPTASPLGVRISKHLQGGVSTPESGVSLTPVNAAGRALQGSEGSLQGASVLYANTQTDTDTLAKPTSTGFELSAILRAQDSPHELFYRLGLPSGASLVQHHAHGPVLVVKEGLTLGMVRSPSAVDTAGSGVPVSMGVEGDVLSVSVDTAGEYQYPLQVDPEYYDVSDRSLTGTVWPAEGCKEGTNWVPIYSSENLSYSFKKTYGCGSESYWREQSWYIQPVREYNASEGVGIRYRTKGESTIYNLEMWVVGENMPSQTETIVQYRYGPEEESHDNEDTLSRGEKQTRYEDEPLSMTSGYFHNPLETPRNNDVRLMDYTTKHESLYGFSTDIQDARVWIAQEESRHPETSSTSACPQCGFNTTEAYPKEDPSRENVLYGSGKWLSPTQGALEVTSHDPGIGISLERVEGSGWDVEAPIYKEGRCKGVQCEETYTQPITWNPSMDNGEYSVELFAENAAENYGVSYHTVKVDASKPYNLGFTGMSEYGAEISAAQHKLTVHATDGKKPTPSSGIRSVSVSIDGGTPSELVGANCPEGECTASGSYTLGAESLSEGVHRLVVDAVSNSGVPAAEEFVFDVRHGSPVSVGPGSVDPTTGQLTLTASDVSLAGASGVSRFYQSRNLAAGASGALGPQWAMSVGGGEGLTVLPSGSVVLVSGSGGKTTFTLNSKGELEAPKGDENLKIEDKASEHKYILKDSTAGSETVFEQPTGTQSTPPNYGGAFGAEAGVLKEPVSEALDGSGNVWVTDWSDDRIAKFTNTGTLIGTYGSEGSESGELRDPFGIAVNQSTGNIYVSDYGNSRIDELSSSGSFIRAIGWGVSNGEAALQTCTSNCKAGAAGAGAGQLSAPTGVAIDSSGHVWVSEEGNDRIQEFSETGGYITSFGSPGSGAGQLSAPMDIAVVGGDLYVADQYNNRVDEFSISGTFVKTIGWGVSNGEAKLETCTSSCKAGIAGTGNGQFDYPRGLTSESVSGSLYVTDMSNNRVQEITSAGAFVSKFGSGGSGPGQFSAPMGIVVSSTGTIYVTDAYNTRVQEWSHAVWWPTSAKGSLPNQSTYTYAAVENSEGVTSMQPYEVTSPTPKGVECGTTLAELKEEKDKGCRALTFKYADETTAKGEKESEWGEYKGDLSQVMFHAWNSSAKTMEEKAVAQYSYDKQGRLRAEWDPRIESSTACGKTCSALKTTYGYDAEGQVTAVSPPGQEPWLLHYGALAGDPSAGRLLSVTRPTPSSKETLEEQRNKLKEQEAMAEPANTTKPTLSSTSPVAGTLLKASSEGAWSNSPMTYSYQWEDCHKEGESTYCSAIPGAVNQSYTPLAQDAGYQLEVMVTAENADGAGVGYSLASNAVTETAPSFAANFGKAGSEEGELSQPVSVAQSDDGRVWVTDYGNNRVEEFTEAGEFIEAIGWGVSNGKSEFEICTSKCQAGISGSGQGQFTQPWGIATAIGHGGDVYVTDMGNSRVEELSETGEFIRAFGSYGSGTGQLDAPHGIAIDSAGNVLVTDYGNNRVEEFTASGGYLSQFGSSGSGNGELSGPDGITEAAGNFYVAEYSNNRVSEFTASGTFVAKFGTAGSGDGQLSGPTSIVRELATGDLYVADKNNNRVEEFDPAGTFINVFGSKGTGNGEFETNGPQGVTVYNYEVYVTDTTDNRIERWVPQYPRISEPAPEPPSVGTSAVSTIEYNVSLSAGSGRPSMTSGEVAKWDQKDDPTEAMAIFPPAKPMGWPAEKYEAATIDYMDADGRTVNVASPAGGISTTEYNELNEAARTLSADNRAAAMKEGCVSVAKKECKSAEMSEQLDTKTEYNAFGSDILKLVGPEHKVKLSTGEEVEARAVTHNYYNEDAKEAEEKNKETYNLVTKTTSGALLSSGEEKDVRTTLTSYAGQHGLGWKLRKATSTTTDPAGLDLTHTTEYSETGAVIETKAPKGTAEVVYPPVYQNTFGSSGSGSGEFNHPEGVAVDASGNVWVADEKNNRIEKFSSTGTFIAAYGSAGSGNDQFASPWGVAVNQSTGNVYVADNANNRIEELSSSGAFVEVIGWGVSDGKAELAVCKTSCKAGIAGSGNGQLKEPIGLTVDSAGNIWVADSGNNRIQEFSSTGAYVSQFGSKGAGNGQLSEPTGVGVDEGEVYVVDYGNDRVEEFSPSGGYLAQFGSKGSGERQFNYPVGVAVNAMSGDLYVSDAGDSRIEEFTPAGKFLTEFGTYGSGNGQLNTPTGLAVNSTGEVYIADQYNERISDWLPQGAGGARMIYSSQFGSSGSGNGQFSYPLSDAIDGHGNVWVTDLDNNRVEEFSSTGKFIAAYGSHGSGHDQFANPTGIAVNQSTGNVYVGDCGNDRVEELNSSGEYVTAFGGGGSEPGEMGCPDGVKIDSSGNVWVADSEHDRIEEYSSSGTFIATYGKAGTGEAQFESPTDLAFSGGNLYVVDSGNHRVEELSTAGKYLGQFGSEGGGDGEFYEPADIAADPAGNLYVVDSSNGRVQEFNAAGTFLARFASQGTAEGQLSDPTGIAINAAGSMYVVDSSNNRVEQWTPVNQAVHDTETIYYTANEEAALAECRNHPEWAGLACQTRPAAQPEAAPNLPESLYTYNIWDELEKTQEKFGTGSKLVTRTETSTYDPAGRALTSEETASPATDTALPKVTNEYNIATGALESQSTPASTVTSKYSTLGQLTEYKDASGNVAKYTYEEGGDGRLEEVSEGKGEEAKSSETYSYNATTGFMEKLVNTAAGMSAAQGTFTASYDVEGKMISETYPNKMTASYTINAVGQATSLVYEKNADCASKCPETWFNDSIAPSIHGETLQQTSTLAKESYAYDNAGRLLETQETPAGKGCVVRLYAYEEESSRTSETAREPGTEGKCAAEGGTVERHTYDEANRLTDAGVEYEAFGNTTKMPSGDAGGHEIVSTYYLDNQLASEEQKKQLLDFTYDPAGRTLETASENKETKAKSNVISHYAGSGNAHTWTCEEEDKKECAEGKGKWSRNIPGIDGDLDAVQTSGGSITLQIHDLEGNIVGTVEDSETVTKPASPYNSTEFGVPQPGTTPPKYAWLGAAGVSTETSFGSGVATQSGASYVPQVARALQTAPVIPPGAFPNGSPGTQFTAVPGAWTPGDQAEANHATEEAEAERQKTKETEAAEALQKCLEEGGCGAVGPGEEEFGDPMRCYVGESTATYGDKAVVDGAGGCHQGLPAGTWIYACVGVETDGGGKTLGACSHIEVKGHTSRYWAIGDSKAVHCERYEIVVALVEFYVPGGKVLYAGTENGGECGGNSDSADEASLTLFGTDDDLGAVQGVLEFFQAELE
jgi:DNA-binding beta-propeller fold protein YncE